MELEEDCSTKKDKGIHDNSNDIMYSHYGDDTCRDDCKATKEIYVEIVEFTHFVKFWTFADIDGLSREKILIDRIKVSAGVYLDYGDTKQFIDKKE
jgi:hypothetical protein